MVKFLTLTLILAFPYYSKAYPPGISDLFDSLPPDKKAIFVDPKTKKLSGTGTRLLGLIEKGELHSAASLLGLLIPQHHDVVAYLNGPAPKDTPGAKTFTKLYLFTTAVQMEWDYYNFKSKVIELNNGKHGSGLNPIEHNTKLYQEIKNKYFDKVKKSHLRSLGKLTFLPSSALVRLLGINEGVETKDLIKINEKHIKCFVFQKHVYEELMYYGKHQNIDAQAIIDLSAAHFSASNRRGGTSVFKNLYHWNAQEKAQVLALCLDGRIL